MAKAIRDDLRSGLDALPSSMRDLVTKPLRDTGQFRATTRKTLRLPVANTTARPDRSAWRRDESGFAEFFKASPQDRRDLFLTAAPRLGTPEPNVENTLGHMDARCFQQAACGPSPLSFQGRDLGF